MVNLVTYRILEHIQSAKSSLSRRALRITSIPTCIKQHELIQCLEEFPSQHGWRSANGSNIKAFTIVSDVRSQVAIVAFYEEPFCVMKCAPGNIIVIELKVKGDVHHAKVDCDFLGMTPLYSGVDGEIFVDIVAVTGLAGHPFGSWKASGANVMWLKDLLPKDIPDCRIFTYGYDSRVERSINNSSISDYARQLLEDLCYIRQTESSKERPLIFIAHSLGGLVVKAALAAAAQSSSHADNVIWQSTVGVFFFGVPNAGLNHENLLSVVKNQRNAGLVGNLMEGSEVLQLLNQYFRSTWRGRSLDCSVVSFYETLDTPTVMEVEGKLKRAGPMIRMVTRESATLSSMDISDHVPITGNHSTIVKFIGDSDPGYRSVVARLLQCIQSTKDLLAAKKNPSIPEKKAECIFMVPIPRNPSYVAREDIHDRLDELLVAENDFQPRAALWALGGMGKTSIALEHCYRYSKDNPSANVFWVNASSDEVFLASYRDISKHIGMQVVDDDNSALQDAVKNWLESPESGEWFMVMDNVDDLEIETKYIPVRQGKILFTTRDSRIIGDPRFAVPANGGLEVRKMSLDEATTMCRTLGIRNESTPSSAQIELLELLENLPLAIAQSAAYIRNTGMSTEHYLELFKQSTANQVNLLDKPLYHFSKDNSSSTRTVMKTWTITIDKIKAENPLAVELLQFMSVIDTENISLDIIRGVPRFKSVGDLAMLESIGLLLNFALLTLVGMSHYRLHRLVSFWSRETMQDDKRHVTLHVATEVLEQTFSEIEDMSENLHLCSQLIPHATVLLHHVEESGLVFDEVAELQDAVGFAFFTMVEYSKALNWYQRALDMYEKTLGKDHPKTLGLVSQMGLVSQKQGDYGKAQERYERALHAQEKSLGKDHTSTLTTINNMALLWYEQGDYDKALEWCQLSLEGREKVLGKNDPKTLATMNNMATIFDEQGKHGKALEWYQRVLEGQETTLGRYHPATLNTVHNMARALGNHGERQSKVLELYRRALDGREKVLGKDHPDTLLTVSNMALIFYEAGNYDMALEWFKRSLVGHEKTLGKDHPMTLHGVNFMAVVLGVQGEYEKALELHKRSLDGRERCLGKDHPDTLVSVECMAMTFYRQKEYDMALELFKRVLKGRERALGRKHHLTVATIGNIALMFQNKKDYDKAREWYQRYLEGCEETLSKDHIDFLTGVSNMGIMFHQQRDYEKAKEYYQRAFDAQETKLGSGHPSTLTTACNMAIMFSDLEEYDKALEWHQRALDGQEKTFGKDHPNTLATVNKIAYVFRQQKKYNEALKWYSKALEGREKSLGKDHSDTMRTVTGMAIAFEEQGEYEKAREWYERALEGQEKVLGKDHPTTLDTAQRMKNLPSLP